MAQNSFSGSIPALYDSGMGPVMFEPYAIETARRVAERGGSNWLEIAAGTGRVTRHLASVLPAEGRLVATDLQEGMLEIARAKIDDDRIRFEVADALALPFERGAFNTVVSQFGVMFYPDRAAGHAEALRVLRPGGTYLLTTWAAREENPWSKVVQALMLELFPTDPPAFFGVPFSLFDGEALEREVREAGFSEVRVEKVEKPAVAEEASSFARGAIAGSPIGGEIVARNVDPERVIERLTERLVERFGDRPMRSTITAIYVTANAPTD